MPILKHAPLAPNHKLNQSVDKYNLIPHDNDQLRKKILHQVFQAFAHLDKQMQKSLKKWVEEADGLKSHAHIYGIYDYEITSSTKKSSSFWKKSVAKGRDKQEQNEDSVPKQKPH